MSNESEQLEQARKSGPHTDPRAMPVSFRTVEHARVVEFTADSGASYRNASVVGLVEVEDSSDLAMARDGIGPRDIRVRLKWFDWEPERGYASMTVTGRCLVHDGYSGRVIAELGRPG